MEQQVNLPQNKSLYQFWFQNNRFNWLFTYSVLVQGNDPNFKEPPPSNLQIHNLAILLPSSALASQFDAALQHIPLSNTTVAFDTKAHVEFIIKFEVVFIPKVLYINGDFISF